MRDPSAVAVRLHEAITTTSDRQELLADVAQIMRPYLVRYFVARTRALPGFDHEAMASEVIARIVRTWGRIELESGQAGVGYAFAIARHHLIDEIRRWEQRRALGIEAKLGDDGDRWDDDEGERHGPVDPQDVAEEVVARDTRDRLFAEVGATGPGGGWLVELAQGATYQDLARRHGVTVKAVKAKLWRARTAVRARLNAEEWR